MDNKLKADTTEEEILNAAKKIFRGKGFAAARMQEIADEAKINKAMLHYYFRSKEALFNKVFTEAMGQFIGRILLIINDQTPWDVKVWMVADKYTDFLEANPEIPMFVLHELNKNGGEFMKQVPFPDIQQSLFIKQISEAREKGHIKDIEPLQVLITLISMIIFPFVATPIIKKLGNMTDKQFSQFVKERKTLVPEILLAGLKP